MTEITIPNWVKILQVAIDQEIIYEMLLADQKDKAENGKYVFLFRDLENLEKMENWLEENLPTRYILNKQLAFIVSIDFDTDKEAAALFKMFSDDF